MASGPRIGWDSAAVLLLYMLWQDFHGSEAAATETMVEEEDITYTTIDFIVLLACLVSIGAVAFLLTSKGANFLDIGFGLFSIIASWATVHALYTLRYAELYYKGVNGGIEFQGTEQPKISDFAYLAFTIGMTYQVSDTALTSTAFRKMALGHALLSFVFGDDHHRHDHQFYCKLEPMSYFSLYPDACQPLRPFFMSEKFLDDTVV